MKEPPRPPLASHRESSRRSGRNQFTIHNIRSHISLLTFPHAVTSQCLLSVSCRLILSATRNETVISHGSTISAVKGYFQSDSHRWSHPCQSFKRKGRRYISDVVTTTLKRKKAAAPVGNGRKCGNMKPRNDGLQGSSCRTNLGWNGRWTTSSLNS
ncbi:hypothetical protein J6590_069461 [Homalodisca vitripennis]|nr:hypothetical protein J6590_069461 [Homalodisca vitripennis]